MYQLLNIEVIRPTAGGPGVLKAKMLGRISANGMYMN
jgi:hypothetical protein